MSDVHQLIKGENKIQTDTFAKHHVFAYCLPSDHSQLALFIQIAINLFRLAGQNPFASIKFWWMSYPGNVQTQMTLVLDKNEQKMNS